MYKCQKYASLLIDILDPDGHIPYRLYREHCTHYFEGYVKDLSLLGRKLSDVIIVDNSPFSYVLQKENAIPIKTWTGLPDDNELMITLNKLIAISNINNECSPKLGMRMIETPKVTKRSRDLHLSIILYKEIGIGKFFLTPKEKKSNNGIMDSKRQLKSEKLKNKEGTINLPKGISSESKIEKRNIRTSPPKTNGSIRSCKTLLKPLFSDVKKIDMNKILFHSRKERNKKTHTLIKQSPAAMNISMFLSNSPSKIHKY